MNRRADVTLAALVLVAAAGAAAVARSFVALGGGGAAGLGAMVAGWLSACLMLVRETPHVPAPVLLVALFVATSAAAFGVAVLGAIVDQRSLARLVRPSSEERLFGETVFVLRSRRPAAFCAGLLRPRVYVTEALVRSLEPAELEAAVRHEATHAAARAPLKSLVARVIGRTIFWLPTLRDLETRFVLTSELAADEAAIRATSPRAVAGALSRMLTQPATAPGFANFADVRIERLLNPAARTPLPLSRVRLALTAAALVVVGALAAARPELAVAEREHLTALAASALIHRLLWERFAVVTGVVAVALLVRRRRHRGSG